MVHPALDPMTSQGLTILPRSGELKVGRIVNPSPLRPDGLTIRPTGSRSRAWSSGRKTDPVGRIVNPSPLPRTVILTIPHTSEGAVPDIISESLAARDPRGRTSRGTPRTSSLTLDAGIRLVHLR